MNLILRWAMIAGVFYLLASAAGSNAQSLTIGEAVRLPHLEHVGEERFHRKDYEHRNLLLFVSTEESAEQSKRWGRVIGPHSDDAIARWNEDHGQKVLIVPILDTSVDSLSYLPKLELKFLIRQLGGSNRDSILIDPKGTIRSWFGPIANDDTLIVLLGSGFKLQAFAIGEPSQAAQARLIAALDADISIHSSSSRWIPDGALGIQVAETARP